MRNLLGIVFLTVTLSWGCTSAPVREDAAGATYLFQKPISTVQKAAVNALVVTGFDIKKDEPTYVEGYRPRKIGLFVGSGGESVGIWLAERSQDDGTDVTIDTERTFVGGAGQKSWDAEVLNEMRKSLE